MDNYKIKFPYKRILVFPGRDLRASLLELAMIDTRIVQRLRHTKQLGNSNVAYPTAEHSRFSHSLGVLYWVTKILTALKDNYNATHNAAALQEMNAIVKNYLKERLVDKGIDTKVFKNDEFLGISWFEQLVRLYGLLHDISHIPFGHTIEDQACICPRHDEDNPRLERVLGMLYEEIRNSVHWEGNEYGNSLSLIAGEYIRLLKSLFVIGVITEEPSKDSSKADVWKGEWENIDVLIRKPLLLTYDIVSNTICADLMDYTLRDTLFSSMPKTFDKILLTSMKIVEYSTTFYGKKVDSQVMQRLGVSISRKKIRHDIITAILDLLRIRYDLTEKVYYHHTKVIIDAMLEKVLRSLPQELLFDPIEIYEKYLGDEGFLALLEHKISGRPDLEHINELLQKIFRRNFYKTVFRINNDTRLSANGFKVLTSCKEPHKANATSKGRTDIEVDIVNELKTKYQASINHGDIIISFPPKKMQRKIAKALIQWTDDQVFPFENLPKETNYSNEVGMLTDRYQSLWSMSVYVSPEKIHYVRLIESVCQEMFEIHNDAILSHYLKATYPQYYESRNIMLTINNKVIAKQSGVIATLRAKGRNNDDDPTKINRLLDDYKESIEEVRPPKTKKDDSGA